jgi:D-alanyl-D-alanine carboxypeptidase
MTDAQVQVREIDSLLNGYYSPNEPGAAVAIMQDGEVVFKKCYGVGNLESKEKITLSTIFNIASITKQFTAMAILQLAEMKKLSLQDSLLKFFPDFNAKVGGRVTVKHLLTHCSGIADHYENTDLQKVKHVADRNVLNAVKDNDSVYFPAGTKYRYSNTAYCLLAMIIEKVTGISYGQYLRRYIFEPAGMKHSQVWDENLPSKKRATGYRFDIASKSFSKSDADENIFFSTLGDGGIYTSVDEYLLWFSALQNATTLNDSLTEMARTIQFRINDQLGYGFGWFVGNSDNQSTAYHTGSNGGFRSIVFSIPAKNYLLVIFSNRTGIDMEEVAIKINKILRTSSKPFTKIEPFISFQVCWPIFAPCKMIPSFLSLFVRNWNVREMALN